MRASDTSGYQGSVQYLHLLLLIALQYQQHTSWLGCPGPNSGIALHPTQVQELNGSATEPITWPTCELLQAPNNGDDWSSVMHLLSS